VCTEIFHHHPSVSLYDLLLEICKNNNYGMSRRLHLLLLLLLLLLVLLLLLLLLNCNWVDTRWQQYTFTHKQYKEYRERNTHNNYKGKNWEVNWEVRGLPRLCELYPGICLTTEEKERKNLS
jgi:hypothetical protein